MKKILILVILVAAAALGYKYFGQDLLNKQSQPTSPEKSQEKNSNKNTQSKNAKTLVFCSEASPEHFVPSQTTSSQTMDATSKSIFDQLVQFERGTTTLVPALAESWDISEDGLTYTFNLRKGVKYHSNKHFTPQRDFNADDVLFSFERQWKENNPYHNVSGSNYIYFKAMGMDKLLTSIEKVDDYTVKFNLSKPEAAFLANLAMDFSSISSEEYAAFLTEKGQQELYDTAPIGTGPFVFETYQKDSVVRFKANEEYWKGRTPVDSLVFIITPDPSVRFAKLRSGECHIMAYPNFADLEAMEKDPNVTLLKRESMNVGYISLNVKKEPLENKKVRKALHMAINKDVIIETIFQGAAKKAKNLMPPTIWSYNDDVQPYPYDIEAAKKLLQEAGFENGFDIELWAMPVQRPYNPNARRMAELVQDDWKKIGVNTKIVSFEWGEYNKRARSGEHMGVMYGWTGDNGDPDNFLHTLASCDSLKSGLNYSRWCYEPYDKLINEAKRKSDVSERTELYKEAQKVFREETAFIPIAHSLVVEPIRKEVKDYKILPLGTHSFYGVDIE